MKKEWTQEELALLASDLPVEEISKLIDRSMYSIYKKRERLSKKDSPKSTTPPVVGDAPVTVLKTANNELLLVIRKEIKDKVEIKFV
jgi:hypothetical protein